MPDKAFQNIHTELEDISVYSSPFFFLSLNLPPSFFPAKRPILARFFSPPFLQSSSHWLVACKKIRPAVNGTGN